jgi:hypothetical protein
MAAMLTDGDRAMYEVDKNDRVVTLEDIPQSSVGAPLPLILANEQRVVLAYYINATDPSWDGKTVRILNQDECDEPIAVVRLDCAAHMSGPPNDEAFSGHPLASRGLHAYGAFRIEGSSWIRKLERMNRVHEHHRPEHFERLHHLVFAFHDSTFECVCRDFDVRTVHGSMLDVTPTMLALLFEKRHR